MAVRYYWNMAKLEEAFTPAKSNGHLIELKKEIPMSWFAGFGTQDRGISSILFSAEFRALGGEDFNNAMKLYSEIRGETLVDDKLITDLDKIPDPSLRNEVRQAAKLVREVTGLQIKDIWKKQQELLKQYRWKRNAPFPITLT